MIAEAIYAACAVAATSCAVLLFRGRRASRNRLLFWACLCFIGLAIDNLMLIVDLVLTPPQLDLFYWRTVPAVVGFLILMMGLIWEGR